MILWSVEATTLLNMIHVQRRTSSTIYLIYKSTASQQYQGSVGSNLLSTKTKTNVTKGCTSLTQSNVNP